MVGLYIVGEEGITCVEDTMFYVATKGYDDSWTVGSRGQPRALTELGGFLQYKSLVLEDGLEYT